MNQREQVLVHLEDACGDLLQEVVHGAKPRIAAWGLVKAGKSSLLNMLSGHVADEFFRTGAVRTTRRNQELETDHYVLVDTPGLGIDQDDSKQAFKGLDSADVTLFVHSPPGELDQEEIDLLIQVKAAYAEETERRLVIVLSQLDKDQNGALESIRNRIMTQLQEHIDLQPICFQVSNTRYRKGVDENKPGLSKKSGIPDLAEYLDTLSLQISSELETVRTNRHAARKVALLDELEKAIEEECRLVASLKKPFTEKMSAFNQMMAELKRTFDSNTTEIEAAQKMLNSI